MIDQNEAARSAGEVARVRVGLGLGDLSNRYSSWGPPRPRARVTVRVSQVRVRVRI